MLSEGQAFAHYVIEAPIGEGGMGAVYRAHDTKLRRKVALKVIHPDLAVPDAAARLVREARAAAALAHPNTIAIHDLGEIDGTVYLVMELISGAPLRAYVGDTSVPVTQKLRWLVDMARGLGAAHKAGLVHRDVKPTNVMVSDDGVVKVLDFGLAKPLEAASFHTDVGLVVGTPRYMAPELFTGVRADARSDQYAFGVTAYELLSGVHPGSPTGPVPAALDSLVPEVGPAVARIVARTLSRAASERFASMNEVAAALEEHIFTTRVSATRGGEGNGNGPPATRREAGGAAGSLALAPTELPSSSKALDPSQGALAPRTTARAMLEAEPAPSRGGGALRVILTLGVVAAVGGYGVSRFAGDRGTTSSSGAPPASAPLSASDDAAVVPDADALDAGAEAGPAALAVLDAEAADASVVPDAGALDADADADAAADPATRKLHLDDFNDPWLKPAPGTR